ncbi:MAG: GNAT family N-acetyltransferase [Lachnospiraceae bacterium]|nr:GNAT family N-acetyltransferase [Lachnospiraceae bacterium]
MLRLRPYKPCDAKNIVSWLNDETTFNLWGGLRFGQFPLSEDTINDKYFLHNGDCVESDNFYPMTAFDESGAVGHFILRYINGDNKILRLGWVIVDNNKRGLRYGQKMLKLALNYAFNILKADTVTIGVFENNTAAYKCYESVGFQKSTILEDSYENINGQDFKIVELEISKESFDGAC